MSEKIKLVGELKLGDVINGGTCFEVEPEQPTHVEKSKEWKESEYIDKLKPHLLLESVGENIPRSDEPFSYLAEQMTNLLSNGKIKKRILKKGYGPYATSGSYVKIHYNAYEEFEAQPFDSTYGRDKPFLFNVGHNEILEGLDISVNSMQLSEKSQFLIHPDLAYKIGGMGRVKPNATVLFIVELLQICNTTPNKDNAEKEVERSFENVYKQCLVLNANAKNKFKLKDYTGAASTYRTAAQRLEDAILRDYDDQLKSDKLLFTFYSNMLVCHTILENPQLGCSFANRIYDLVKNKTVDITAKVYFNNAKCLRMLGHFCLAEKRLKIAKQMEGNNREIDEEFEVLNRKRNEYKAKMGNLRKAFG